MVVIIEVIVAVVVPVVVRPVLFMARTVQQRCPRRNRVIGRNLHDDTGPVHQQAGPTRF